MATRNELNQLYKKYYNKDFPSSTLSKWVKEGKIKASKMSDNRTYNYDLNSFKQVILNPNYAKKIKATKEKPKDYIGKQIGYLLIKDIVPKEERKESNYKGTLMYCQCLKCNRPDLIQVRFSYLTPNGNYHQTTCGCGRKEKAFLATTRKDIREDFLNTFNKDFEKFLFIHKALTKTTDKYYNNCSIKIYEEAIEYFYYNNNFNKIYNFWQNNQNNDKTFYDWAKPSLDHIIPKSRGGSNELNNLQFLTVFENLAKRDMTWEEWNIFKEKTHTKSDYFIENIK